MSFFPDSSMTRHFPFENSTIKSWSHIWLMLNRFILRPSTYRTFAISGSPGKEMIPFPLICDFLPSPKVTLPSFLDLKNLEERSVSGHVSWAAAIKVPQTSVHNLKCRLEKDVGCNQFNAQILVLGLLTNLRNMLAAKFFSSSIRWRSWSSLITKPYGVQT